MKSLRLFPIQAFAIAVITACSGNISTTGKLEYIEPEFKKVINADVKVLNDDFLFNYGTMQVVDTLIVYSGLTDVSDKIFHVFSKNTGKYLTSFGNVGRAYGEISQQVVDFSVDRKTRIMYVYDSWINKTVSYSLDKVMSGANDYAKELNLPDVVGNTTSTRFFRFGNSFLAGESFSGRFLICTENDSVTCSNIYPELGVEPVEYRKVEKQYFRFEGCMSAKPDGTMFVNATFSGCVFEIWKYESDSISPCVAKGFFRPEYDTRYREMNYPTVIPTGQCGILELSCTDKCIYALYRNDPDVKSKRIAVFDWKGNPEKLYVTKDNPMAFDVDKDRTAYALMEDEEGNIKLVSIEL